MLTHKELKTRALSRVAVKAEYDRLDEEFSFIDQFLKARSAAGITQTEVAERIGTTQSAIARLESERGEAFAFSGYFAEICAGARLSSGVAAG